MNIDERVGLVKQVGEEILTEEELRELFSKKKNPLAYDGFEPSGKVHIAQGMLKAINVNKMTKAGCTFVMLVADWHAWINNKLGGNLENIQTTGKYFEEVWKASGMDLDKVKFINCTTFVNDPEYWKKVLEIAKHTTIQRMLRCGQIMNRDEKEMQYTGQLFYPAMQAADIFHLKADICQLGMDQRKVNILARELGPKRGWHKPVAVHHHMLMGLSQPPASSKESATDRAIHLKMSKSNPDSAIFMTDSTAEVDRKIGGAYCPAKQTEENPILEYCKYIIFEKQSELVISRPAKYGGELQIKGYEELEKQYKAGLHPQDLKKAVATAINTHLEPVRKHFSKGKAKQLLEQVQGFQVTR